VIAIDANVLVRFIVRDDPDQAAVAIDCIRDGVFVTGCVLMETEWVLRSNYRMNRAGINSALSDLLNTDTVAVSDPVGVAWALDRHAAGADLTDMLHLISVRDLSAFVTFDRGLKKKAGDDAPVEIVSL
jgi:predicted nucleic-acid-binding protein